MFTTVCPSINRQTELLDFYVTMRCHDKLKLEVLKIKHLIHTKGTFVY